MLFLVLPATFAENCSPMNIKPSEVSPVGTAGVDASQCARVDAVIERTLAAQRLIGVVVFNVPGTAWGYSLGMDVLGAVMARAGGESLPSLVLTVTALSNTTAEGMMGNFVTDLRNAVYGIT
jgi:hypothetical protein